MSYWALIISQANKERLAVQNIANQKYEYYFPMFREKIIKNNEKIEVARPLFPRYIFVRIVQQWSSLTGTYGVSGVVMDGQEPRIVQESVLSSLRNREDKNGFVELDKKEGFLRGEPVTLKSGPLKDKIGIYDGMTSDERAIILFKMLGGSRPVKVNPKLLVSL